MVLIERHKLITKLSLFPQREVRVCACGKGRTLLEYSALQLFDHLKAYGQVPVTVGLVLD